MISGLKDSQRKFKDTQTVLSSIRSPLISFSTLDSTTDTPSLTTASSRHQELLRPSSDGSHCSRAWRPRTHFKGLEPLPLLDVGQTLIALLLEVLSLLLIQQAHLIQECRVAPHDLRRKRDKHKCHRARERLGKPICLVK